MNLFIPKAFITLCILFTLCTLPIIIFEQGINAFIKGKIQSRVEEVTLWMRDADRIELSLLSLNLSENSDNAFPEKEKKEFYPVIDQVNITGNELNNILEKWHVLSTGNGIRYLCHEPPYGLRFYSKDKLIFETTMCWKCNNFYIDVDVLGIPIGTYWWGFDAQRPEAQALLDIFKKTLPLQSEYTQTIHNNK